MTRPAEPLDAGLQEFVEGFARWFDRLPPMGGRILAWLLVCDPPEQSMQDLARNLNASMGSMSSMVRLLEESDLIERVTVPGERRAHYRIEPGVFTSVWDDQVRRMHNLKALVDQALDSLAATDPQRRERLEFVDRFARFYLGELPELVAKWNTFIETDPPRSGP